MTFFNKAETRKIIQNLFSFIAGNSMFDLKFLFDVFGAVYVYFKQDTGKIDVLKKVCEKTMIALSQHK
jgi:predicted patatin/cPLA2 family phospholipase